jgi:hypothetical protein
MNQAYLPANAGIVNPTTIDEDFLEGRTLLR